MKVKYLIFETWAFTKKCLPKNIWAVKNLIWYFIILKNSKCFEMKGENAQKLVMLFASAQGCQSAKLAKMRNCCPWFQFVLLPLVNNLSIKKIIYITIIYWTRMRSIRGIGFWSRGVPLIFFRGSHSPPPLPSLNSTYDWDLIFHWKSRCWHDFVKLGLSYL